MGSFIVRQDVVTELNISLSETTQPSSVEVEHMIEDIEADVRGVLAVAKVAAPTKTANPYAYRIVSMMALWGVCARVQAAFGGNVINASPREEMYWGRYKDARDLIIKNPRYLADATQLTTSAALDVDGITDDDDEYHEAIHSMDDEY